MSLQPEDQMSMDTVSEMTAHLRNLLRFTQPPSLGAEDELIRSYIHHLRVFTTPAGLHGDRGLAMKTQGEVRELALAWVKERELEESRRRSKAELVFEVTDQMLHEISAAEGTHAEAARYDLVRLHGEAQRLY